MRNNWTIVRGLLQFHKYANSIARVVESGPKNKTIEGAGFVNFDPV